MTFMTQTDKQNILERLTSLIHLYSEVMTTGEANINVILYSELSEWEYFSNHPSHCGLYPIEDDPLKRQVLWSFVNTGSEETIILFGHCDTVGIDNYNELMAYALEPEALRRVLIESKVRCRDLEDDNWLFGRGSSDMKAGLAVQLYLMEKVIASPEDYPNILWLSVPDEEYLSAGMRAATKLIDHLKTTFNLKIPLAILSEPHARTDEDTFVTYAGSAGKLKPMIVTRGIETHAGDIFSGFNAIGIMTEIVKAIELNTEMSDLKYREMTSPPAFMGLRDLKQKQDVTTPEFIAGFFNWTFLNNTFENKFEQLRSLCVWSLEDAINQYNYSKNEYLRKQCLPSYEACCEFKIDVLFFHDLLLKMPETFDLKAFVTKQTYALGLELNDPVLLANVIKQMMIKADIEGPAVVIGLLPPFYPAKDSTVYYESKLEPILKSVSESLNINLELQHFFMKISDMSYLGNETADYTCVEQNLPHFKLDYTMSFEALDKLNIQVVNIGPWGKDLHLKTERVYLPDVTETVPIMTQAVLKSFKKKS
jgi:arginine utilization protein RocB